MTLNLGREITASFTDSVVWSVATGLLFLAELIFSQDKDGRSEVHQMVADCQNGK